MFSAVARMLVAVAVGALSALPAATPVAADAVSPSGRCSGTATWTEGDFTEETGALDVEDVIEIPRKDQVRWSGKVVGPTAGAERRVSGRVYVALPPPFGGITVGRWGPTGTEVEKSGTYDYNLPSLVPADVEFDLWASHNEGGDPFCRGAVGLVIEGGPFDSPVIWVALIGLLLFTVLLGLLGRRPAGGDGFGRAVLGALVGLLFGLFAAATIVLFGLLPLASVLVTVIVAAGLVLGAIWAKWAPLGGGGGSATPSAAGE